MSGSKISTFLAIEAMDIHMDFLSLTLTITALFLHAAMLFFISYLPAVVVVAMVIWCELMIANMENIINL